jgi:uncharacterized membrane protein YesL
MMIRALRLLRATLSAWYYDLFVLAAVNIVWFVLCLLILPIGPATAGLFYVSNEVAKGEPIWFRLFWVGVRRFLGLSIRLSIVIVAVTILLIVNCVFYLRLQSTIGMVVGIVWAYSIVFWGFLLTYPFALLVNMENPGIIKIMRAAILLVLDNVILTVSMSILAVLLLAISLFPFGGLPIPVGLAAFIAIFQCKAVIQLFAKYDERSKRTTA